MLHKLSVLAVTAGLAAAGTFLGPAQKTEAGILCLQGQGGVVYQIRFGAAGDDLAVGGVRISPTAHNVPITGSAYANSAGTVVIGVTEQFDYGSGAWSEPVGTTVFRISGTTVTFDSTYSGATTTPINVTGTGAVVTCPATISSTSTDALGALSSTDPNGRGAGSAVVQGGAPASGGDANSRAPGAPAPARVSGTAQGDPNSR